MTNKYWLGFVYFAAIVIIVAITHTSARADDDPYQQCVDHWGEEASVQCAPIYEQEAIPVPEQKSEKIPDDYNNARKEDDGAIIVPMPKGVQVTPDGVRIEFPRFNFYLDF